jgi:hypothetical protein
MLILPVVGWWLRYLAGKHLHYTIAATADNPATILAPDDRADALSTHHAVARDLLNASALLEGPEPQRGVMPSAYKFPAVWTER